MRVEIYKDEDGDWRWRIRASNDDIVGDSGEGYENKVDCMNEFLKILYGLTPFPGFTFVGGSE